MIKRLAIKELRESLGLAALAVLGMAWFVSSLMGFGILSGFARVNYGQDSFAFWGDGFVSMTVVFLGGLAVALGLKQSAWEHGRGTYYFLLHRPIERWHIIATKLVVGIALVLLILTGSIVWYGVWASTPGKRAVPFEWSMAAGAWNLALTLPLVYLGAFLSGMRPGNWFGTRLFPLAGTIGWTMLLGMQPFWWLTVPIALVGYGCVLTAIVYHTQTRDY